MAKNERKLTPAEQKRKEQFALVCEEMERQGYRKIDLTIGVVKANLLALIVMLPFAVLSGAVVLSSYSLRSMIKSPITSSLPPNKKTWRKSVKSMFSEAGNAVRSQKIKY